jgi:hypothetical protein
MKNIKKIFLIFDSTNKKNNNTWSKSKHTINKTQRDQTHHWSNTWLYLKPNCSKHKTPISKLDIFYSQKTQKPIRENVKEQTLITIVESIAFQ